MNRSNLLERRGSKFSKPGLVIAVAILVSVPWIVPVLADEYWVSIVAEMMIWGLFAASINFLRGYTGLLSFGQALYFGLGAYGVAFAIHYFNLGVIPAFFIGVAMATVGAAVTGPFAVRLSWHYFMIITVVFSLIFYLVAVGWKDLTNGDDGIALTLPSIGRIGGFEVTLLDPKTQYFAILVIVATCFYLQYIILRSPLGKAFAAIRENLTRAELIGLNSYRLRLYSFMIAGLLAGVAGSLFALFSRYVSAQYMYWTVSGEGVIWVIVGGSGTLFGPVVGATLLILLREELSRVWDHYLIIVGIIVFVVVIFAPKGVLGTYYAWSKSGRDRRSSETNVVKGNR